MTTVPEFGGPGCMEEKNHVASVEGETDVDATLDCCEDHEHCEIGPVTSEVGICSDCVKRFYQVLLNHETLAQ